MTGPIEVAGAAHLVVVSGATMLRPDKGVSERRCNRDLV